LLVLSYYVVNKVEYISIAQNISATDMAPILEYIWVFIHSLRRSSTIQHRPTHITYHIIL